MSENPYSPVHIHFLYIYKCKYKSKQTWLLQKHKGIFLLQRNVGSSCTDTFVDDIYVYDTGSIVDYDYQSFEIRQQCRKC